MRDTIPLFMLMIDKVRERAKEFDLLHFHVDLFLRFDSEVFVSKVNGGRAISDYRKDQTVFRQGDPSDAVFYIRRGKVRKTVASK